MKFLVLICILNVLVQRTLGNVQSICDYFSEEDLSDTDFNDDHFEHQPPEINLSYPLDDDEFLPFLPI